MDPQKRIAELEAKLEAKGARIDDLESEVRAKTARIDDLEQLIDQLTRKVEELTERLGQNSGNSHKPPSSDGPGKPKNPRKRRSKSGRKRGAQPGHEGHSRQLLPAEQVDDIVHLFPDECENCWAPLSEIPDLSATRYQTTEVPPIRPHTVEHRCHAVGCEACGHTTRASNESIPASPFGPRLMALIALLTGIYHLSRRKAVTLLSDVVGVRISLGAVSAVEARVSEAVNPAVEEAWERVEDANVKHTDATGWLNAGATLSLWTIATAAATVFKILKDGTAVTIKPLFGALKGILISDRATVFGFWAMKRRQICWAHLLRKFVSFSERDGPAKNIGNDLLNLTGIMFEYWHDYQDGKLTKSTFGAWLTPVQRQFEALLEHAVMADIDRLSGSCADILAHRQALWTFTTEDGVEPTNNHAERELRAFVLWRKRSFGAQSERGNLFAERLMTVAHTARKQNKHVLSFLTECCQAQGSQMPAPSLFDTQRYSKNRAAAA